MVEEHPEQYLDTDGLELALGKARAMLPGVDIEKTLATQPEFVFKFQRGSKLIPYDEPRPEQPRQDDDDSE